MLGQRRVSYGWTESSTEAFFDSWGRSKIRYVLLLCIGGAILSTIPAPALAVALWGTGSVNLTDIPNEPNRFYRWDPDPDFLGTPVIHWKMTNQFRQRFPLAKQQEQVRLGIAEWEEGIFSATRRAAPTYGWTRWSGVSDFFDLRTIVTHELGHVLGSQHTDAAWFNDSDGDDSNGIQPFQLNFRRVGNAWQAGPPLGGEIMNEGNDAVSLPGSKPTKGLPPGAYWRTLSQDELDFLDHAYPVAIDFVEVGPNANADLEIDLFAVGAGPGGNNAALGIGGPDSTEAFDSNDPSQGRRILAASAKVREEASLPIGFKALPRNWEITNDTGESINSVIITARGTNNPIPTTWSSDEFTFQGALAPPPPPDPRAFDLEDVAHLFTSAQNGPVGSGQTVEVGLRKDVWDWTVAGSQAIQSDGDFVDIGLVSITGFNVVSPVVPSGDDPGDDLTTPDDGLFPLQGTFDVLAQGFQIINQDSIEVTVSELAVGAAPDLDPNRTDLLNADTLAELSRFGDLQFVSLDDPFRLDPGEAFFFLLFGDPSGLPEDVLQGGNWMAIDVPSGIESEQLFVYAATQGGGFQVGNFALLNTPVFGLDATVPEPGTFTLAIIVAIAGLCSSKIARRGRR